MAAAQSLAVSATDTTCDIGAKSWFVSARASDDWIMLNPSGGDLPGTVQVRPSAAALLTSPTPYRGQLTVTVPGAANTPQTVDVELTVKPQPGHGSTLAVTIDGGGRVNGSDINCPNQCQSIFAIGSQISLSAAPGSGWRFERWEGACAGLSEPTCSLTLRDQTVAVTARFAPTSVAPTLPGQPTVTASATWLTTHAPFQGDRNRNGLSTMWMRFGARSAGSAVRSSASRTTSGSSSSGSPSCSASWSRCGRRSRGGSLRRKEAGTAGPPIVRCHR